jgi:hypothetical protein
MLFPNNAWLHNVIKALNIVKNNLENSSSQLTELTKNAANERYTAFYSVETIVEDIKKS